MQTAITTFDNSVEGWERALYAFLAEKERRSGTSGAKVGSASDRPLSRRTINSW